MRRPVRLVLSTLVCVLLISSLLMLKSLDVRPTSRAQMESEPLTRQNTVIQNASQYKFHSLPLPKSKRTLHDSAVSDSLTVVTAYFNLGRFRKGEVGRLFYEPNLYMHWLHVFSRIDNPVIAYFDMKQDLDYFNKLRNELGVNRTKSVLLNRDKLWSFGLYSKINSIICRPNYPKYEPNTVFPEYACAMHAKYELMQRSVFENPFRTKYFCWLDVGLFRALAKERGPAFKLHLPPNFDPRKVAYTEVFKPFEAKVALEQIFLSNAVWVCGCFFIAEQSVMLKWTEEYMQYAQFFLDEGYSNTDQQVIYALFNRGKPHTGIQIYREKSHKYNAWFYLGYLCKF